MMNLIGARGRFWSKVALPDDNIMGQNLCWEWRGAKRGGYGAIKIDGKMWIASRVAYLLTKGEIPDGKVVMHLCDNPGCCNPRHLILGSVPDNNKDAALKKRTASGTSNSQSVLTENQVRAIRSDPRSKRQIALMYGVDANVVTRIKNGTGWKNVL